MTDTKDLRDEFALAALPGVIQAMAADVRDNQFGVRWDGASSFEEAVAVNVGKVADAMMAERRSREDPQAEPWEAAHGYQEAFYKIAEILGVGALPTTPAQAFASVIVPKLRELMAAHGRKA